MYKEHFIFKTNKIAKLKESSSEVARIWKKSGCNDITLWELGGSSIGLMALTLSFNDVQEYGTCMNKFNKDPDWLAWSIKYEGNFEYSANPNATLIEKF